MEECYGAVRKAKAEEAEKTKKEYLAIMKNMNLYAFCKVAVNFPQKPYFYYFVGDLHLKVGDRVVVPLGIDNEEKEGVVVAVEEYYAAAFPCPANRIKTVIKQVLNS